MALRPVRVFLGYPAPLRPPVLPVGAVVDTSGGASGFLGHVGSAFFTLAQATLVGGLRITTTNGEFSTIGSGDEDPVADLKFTCFRIFPNNGEEQSKFSASPAIDISSGTWSGTAGARFDRAVLLAAGDYRVDFVVSLTEDYEFGEIANLSATLAAIKFEPHEATAPDGTPIVGLHSYTSYNLTTGAAGQTSYEWDEDEPPLAVDVETYRMNLIDFCAYILARGLGDVPNENRRSLLAGRGYIDNSGNPGGWANAINQTNANNGHEAGGGALLTQRTIKTAIMRILFEMRCALDWTGHLGRILFIPDTSQASGRTITLDDIQRVSKDDPTPRLSITYTPEDDVINSIDARYLRDYSQSGGDRDSYRSALDRRQNATSVTHLGLQEDAPSFWFNWVRDEAHADDVASCWRTHLGEPKKVVEFEGFRDLLELQRGDIISFNLTPNITIGPSPGDPDENQGFGEGGFGSGGFGGQPIIPEGTIVGEVFDGLTPEIEFMVEQVQVDWSAKPVAVKVRAREVP